jgi:hypothetical protein
MSLHKMRFILLIIIIFQFGEIVNCQKTSNFSFFLGYGYFEGYNIGSEYYFNSEKQSISLSFGYDRLMNQENIAMTFCYNYAIFGSFKNDLNELKWHLNNKIVLWQLEDEYYLWRAVSLIPAVNRRFSLSGNLKMSFDFGPAFNIVLYNKRKTYKEVGWPYHVMPDFRILFIY